MPTRAGYGGSASLKAFAVLVIAFLSVGPALVTPSLATVPGVNGMIVFTAETAEVDIHVVNPDGSDLTQLTETGDGQSDRDATWSPDGQRIVWSVRPPNEDVPAEIYVMNADGSDRTRLTNNDRPELAPEFSPDGTKIVFQSQDQGNAFSEISVMNADGTNRVLLTNDDDMSGENAPSWSPDGTKIAFTSHVGGNDDDNEEIFVMNANGSNQTQLTDNEFRDANPNWSPDGTKLVFDSNRDAFEHQNGQAVGAMVQQLRGGNGPPRVPPEIYVMNSDGSDPERITNNDVSDLQPVWSPDGKKIALSVEVEELEDRTIFVMNADGSGRTQIVDELAGEGPDWQRVLGAGESTPTPATTDSLSPSPDVGSDVGSDSDSGELPKNGAPSAFMAAIGMLFVAVGLSLLSAVNDRSKDP